MARADNNPLFQGVRGRIGDIVVKQYSYGTVITKVPDMPKRRRLSELQKYRPQHFRDAVAYAKDIIRDPKKKAAYAKKLPKGKQVYHAALQEYFKKVRDGERKLNEEHEKERQKLKGKSKK